MSYYDGPDDYDAWEGPIVDAPEPTVPAGVVVVAVPPRLPVIRKAGAPEDLMRQLGWQLPADYPASMIRFRRAGLSEAVMGWLIATTQMKYDLPTDARWRYFCGCCWRTIRGEM